MSNKTEILSFDEWFDENESKFEYPRLAHKSAKQAWNYEQDKLQKRLDEINNHLEINYDENRDDDSCSYWSGYNQALRELYKILKGE